MTSELAYPTAAPEAAAPEPAAPEPAQPSADRRAVRFMKLIVALSLAAGALGLIGVGLTLYLNSPNANRGIPGLDLIRHLTHPSGEATVYSWFSVLLLIMLALCFTVIAMTHWTSRALRWRYLVLGATALLLSADEAALLHEKMAGVASALSLGWSWTYSWLIVAVPLAVVAGLFLLWIAKGINPVLRRRLLLAGVLFLFGAVGMEVVGGLLETGTVPLEGFTQLVVLHSSILIEESLEVAGVIVALWATLSYLRVEAIDGGLRISTDG